MHYVKHVNYKNIVIVMLLNKALYLISTDFKNSTVNAI